MKQCNKCSAQLFDKCTICGICGSNDLKQTTVQKVKKVDTAQVPKSFGKSFNELRLENYDHFAIIGTKGSGKTFLAETIKKMITERHGITCVIHEEKKLLAWLDKKEWAELNNMMTHNRHQGVKNILIAPNIRSIPKGIQLSNLLVIATSMTEQMAGEFTEHKPIIESFAKMLMDVRAQNIANNTEPIIRKYLAMSNNGSWIGDFEQTIGVEEFTNPAPPPSHLRGKRKIRKPFNRRYGI